MRRNLCIVCAVIGGLLAFSHSERETARSAAAPSRSGAETTAVTVIRKARKTVVLVPMPTAHGVAQHPQALDVLVNKRVALPPGFQAKHLVAPTVAFIFSGYAERRLLRAAAAHALERLFAEAERAGVPLAGVSGYRSQMTQAALFASYRSQVGLAGASRFSARAGHSEHETGLAVDVTTADGRCPAEPCFGSTRASRWLARHAAGVGFIIRYPRGAEKWTGYIYEPWHLRYLGRRLAERVVKSGLTYDQYVARARRTHEATRA